MNWNSPGVVLSSGGLAAAERSEGSGCEPERGAVEAKAGANPGAASRPDPEVVAKSKRRTYTAEYDSTACRCNAELTTGSTPPAAVAASAPQSAAVSRHRLLL